RSFQLLRCRIWGHPQITQISPNQCNLRNLRIGRSRSWDIRHQAGVTLAPGQYQVRLNLGSVSLVQPLQVLIEPRVAADGVTVADLQEQFEHNMHMREL
ncbi:MAG TPA: hypothetical protein VKA97_05850, partial [Pyrinomonadaceae bacterium]|nr:hypothetical protein [Pyrinomonadaceae bacterium]